MTASRTVGRLQAKLGMDATAFRTGLRQSRTELDRFSSGVTQVGTKLTRVLGLSLGGLGFARIVGQVRSAVKSVAELGDAAKRAGMSADAFQRWKAVAEQSRIGIDVMTDGLKELQKRADEAVETGGGAAEGFERLGLSAEQLKAKLKDPSELMLEIIGRLGQMSKSAQIGIADKIFGGGAGARFVELIGQGQDGIRRIMQSATVISDQQIEAAAELDRRYTELLTKLSDGWKRLAVEIAGVLTPAKDDIAEMMVLVDEGLFKKSGNARAILGDDIVSGFERAPQAVDQHRAAILRLKEEYLGLSGSFASVRDSYLRLANRLFSEDHGVAAGAVGDLADGITDLNRMLDEGTLRAGDYEAKMEELISKAIEAVTAIQSLDEPRFGAVLKGLENLSNMLRSVRDRAAEARAAMPTGATPDDDRGQAIREHAAGKYENSSPLAPKTSRAPKPAPAGVGGVDWGYSSDTGKSGGGGSSSLAGFAKALEDTRSEIVKLTAEAAGMLEVAASGKDIGDAMAYAQKRAELLAAAMEDGRELTPALKAEIDALALGYANAGDAAEAAAQKLKEIEGATERGESAFESLFGAILDGSGSAMKALADLLAQMAKVQFAKGMLGLLNLAPGGSTLIKAVGGLVGANATGTSNWRGGLTRINELGGEILNLPKGTQIIPNDISKRMADGAAKGGGSLVKVVASHDPGILLQVIDERVGSGVRQGLGAYDRQLPNRMQKIGINPRKR